MAIEKAISANDWIYQCKIYFQRDEIDAVRTQMEKERVFEYIYQKLYYKLMCEVGRTKVPKLITNTQIKRAVKNCEREECVEIILEIVDACPQAREFLTMKFTDNHCEILEKYKKKIQYEFYPPHGGFGKLRLKDAKKAISDFMKMCSDKAMTIDIMLFYVENCIAFTNDYGDIDENFYNSALGIYSQIVKSVNVAGFGAYEKFADRLKACVDDTRDIGWGFHDELYDMYLELDWIDHENT